MFVSPVKPRGYALFLNVSSACRFHHLLFASVIKAVSFIKAEDTEKELELRVWRLCWL